MQRCKDTWATNDIADKDSWHLKGQIAVSQSLIDADADQYTESMNDE